MLSPSRFHCNHRKWRGKRRAKAYESDWNRSMRCFFFWSFSWSLASRRFCLAVSLGFFSSGSAVVCHEVNRRLDPCDQGSYTLHTATRG